MKFDFNNPQPGDCLKMIKTSACGCTRTLYEWLVESPSSEVVVVPCKEHYDRGHGPFNPAKCAPDGIPPIPSPVVTSDVDLSPEQQEQMNRYPQRSMEWDEE